MLTPSKKVRTRETARDYGPIAGTLRTNMALLEYATRPMRRGVLFERLLQC